MSDDWQVVEEALNSYLPRDLGDPARDSLARLREREAKSTLRATQFDNGRRFQKQRAEAAEARVAELESYAYFQDFAQKILAAQARVARLEEALTYIRDYPGDPVHVHEAARRALAHEEEKQYPPIREGGPMMPSVAHEEEK